jgi:hypothetical protein
MVHPARAIVGAEALRHDALAAESAGVLEDGRTVTFEVLVKGYAIAWFAKEISERVFAGLERLLAEVVAVELDQVEGAEHGGMVVVPVAEEIED